MSTASLTSIHGRTCARSHTTRASRHVTASEGTILAAVCLLVLTAALAPNLRASQGPSGTTTVLVRPHESLWTIAASHPCPGRTTAETVDVIRSLNGLSDATLHAGTVLRVPAGETVAAVAQR